MVAKIIRRIRPIRAEFFGRHFFFEIAPTPVCKWSFSLVVKSKVIAVIRLNLVQLRVGWVIIARGSHIADCVFNTSILNAVICPLCHQHCGGSHRPRRCLTSVSFWSGQRPFDVFFQFNSNQTDNIEIRTIGCFDCARYLRPNLTVAERRPLSTIVALARASASTHVSRPSRSRCLIHFFSCALSSSAVSVSRFFIFRVQGGWHII